MAVANLSQATNPNVGGLTGFGNWINGTDGVNNQNVDAANQYTTALNQQNQGLDSMMNGGAQGSQAWNAVTGATGALGSFANGGAQQAAQAASQYQMGQAGDQARSAYLSSQAGQAPGLAARNYQMALANQNAQIGGQGVVAGLSAQQSALNSYANAAQAMGGYQQGNNAQNIAINQAQTGNIGTAEGAQYNARNGIIQNGTTGLNNLNNEITEGGKVAGAIGGGITGASLGGSLTNVGTALK